MARNSNIQASIHSRSFMLFIGNSTKATIAMASLSVIAQLAFGATSAHAQAGVGLQPNCTYRTCALGVVPRWDGLAVTRGESSRPVALLGFFWPGDVRGVFIGDDDALDAATDAILMRQAAAVMTDGGLILVATGIARALFTRDWDKLSTAMTVIGGASLGASVPLQFAADGHLSRAVWLFNRRYSK
jgi:hypothetical protein